MSSKELENAKSQISSNLGEVNIEYQLEGGVSRAEVYRIQVNGQPRVLKIGLNEGIREKNGRELLAPFLPLPEVLLTDQDFCVYDYIPGPTLGEAIITAPPNQIAGLLDQYVKLQQSLWEATTISNDNNTPSGYPQKLRPTAQLLLSQELETHSGEKVRLERVADLEWIVNQLPVGKLAVILDHIQRLITSPRPTTVLAHGDESPLNAILKDQSGETVFIDFGGPGRKVKFEPLAKMLGNLFILYFQGDHWQYVIDNDAKKVYLQANITLPDNIRTALQIIRQLLSPLISSDEDKKQLAAFLMMTLFRELRKIDRRGRSSLKPHLITSALYLAPALTGENFPFPVSQFYDDKSI